MDTPATFPKTNDSEIHQRTAPCAVLPRPSVDEEIAHGYTLTQVNGMAVFAARECNWVDGMAMTHRAEVAWSAIVEQLHTAHDCPEARDLIATGWAAMKAQYHRDLHTRGFGGRDRTQMSRAYLRYWQLLAAPSASHEDAIVDRLAFWQIWTQLPPSYREVLRAVADHPDRASAQRALGLTQGGFYCRLTRARQAFAALWHEGYTPPPLWGADRPGARHQNPMYLLRLRKTKAARRAAQPPRPPKRIGRPPLDLGISDTDLLARHEAGESINTLARAFGVSTAPIRSRIAAARQQPTAC